MECGKHVQNDQADKKLARDSVYNEARIDYQPVWQGRARRTEHNLSEPANDGGHKSCPRDQDDHDIKTVMGERSDPTGVRTTICRRIGRSRCRYADGKADDHQDKNQHSAEHVRLKNADTLKVGIRQGCKPEETQRQFSDDEGGQHPMKHHQQRMIAGYVLHCQSSPATTLPGCQ